MTEKSEKQIPDVVATERFQLLSIGANMATSQMQHALNCQDQFEARNASRRAKSFFGQAIEMIENALKEISDGDETLRLHNDVDSRGRDDPGSEGNRE